MTLVSLPIWNVNATTEEVHEDLLSMENIDSSHNPHRAHNCSGLNVPEEEACNTKQPLSGLMSFSLVRRKISIGLEVGLSKQ